MNRKISSIVLSAMLLGETSLAVPMRAVNEKKPDTTKSQNNQKTENEDSYGVTDFALDAAYFAGLSLVGYGTYKYLDFSKSPNQLSYRKIVENLKNDDKAYSSFIPLRSISSRKNLCWFNSSILLYYYNPVYNQIISSFPIGDAKQALTCEKLDDVQKASLQSMIWLSEIFKDLHGNRQDPNYGRPQVIHLNDERVRSLIDSLRTFSQVSGLPIDEQTLNYGVFCNLCSPQLYNAIDTASKTLISSSNGRLQAWASEVLSGAPKVTLGGHSIFGNTAVNIEFNEAQSHFWVNVSRGEGVFEIGKSLNDQQSINLVEHEKKEEQPATEPKEKVAKPEKEEKQPKAEPKEVIEEPAEEEEQPEAEPKEVIEEPAEEEQPATEPKEKVAEPEKEEEQPEAEPKEVIEEPAEEKQPDASDDESEAEPAEEEEQPEAEPKQEIAEPAQVEQPAPAVEPEQEGGKPSEKVEQTSPERYEDRPWWNRALNYLLYGTSVSKVNPKDLF